MYSELGESGTKRIRPAFDELMSDARAGRFGAVLIDDSGASPETHNYYARW